MEKFFTAILLIALAGIAIVVYYGFKGFLKKRNEQKLKQKYYNKFYNDEKNYVRNLFKFLLVQLESGAIQWILVASRRFPWDKIEITFSMTKKEIEIKDRECILGSKEKHHLVQLGVKSYLIKDDIQVLTSSVNSKIITDIIYYLLEYVHNQKTAVNIKVTTSGGYI
jgi:hypothetical protein